MIGLINADVGPSWQVIAVGSVGLLVAIISTVIGAYVKGMGKRVDKLEGEVVDLGKMVLKDYHTKEEISRLLSDLRTSIEALHARFDRAGFPSSHTKGEL